MGHLRLYPQFDILSSLVSINSIANLQLVKNFSTIRKHNIFVTIQKLNGVLKTF